MNLFLRRPWLALALLAGAGLSLLAFCAPESIDFYVFHVRDSFLSLMRPEETGRYLDYRVVEGEPVETAVSTGSAELSAGELGRFRDALGEARFICTAHAVVEFVPGDAGRLAPP